MADRGFTVLVGQRYQQLALLGEGGMGCVYRVLDRLTGRQVALKRVALSSFAQTQTVQASSSARSLGSRSSQQPSAQRTFRLALAHEFRTLATLRHPNIVSVLDYGFDEEREPFFTMELLETPRDLLTATRTASLPEKLGILAQLLRALSYLHRHNIVHRDLKPSNIQVIAGKGGPQLKLLDFGIAFHSGANVELSGTLTYMAPEVLSGAAPSPASDLFAVGIILYQMLLGRLPYRPLQGVGSDRSLCDPTYEESSRLVLGTESPLGTLTEGPLLTMTQTVSAPMTPRKEEHGFDMGTLEPPLAQLVQSLLATEPNQRPQHAEEVLQQLSSILQAQTGTPLPADTAESRDSFLQAAILVGRERELARLESALRAAAQGQGSLILLGGESGVGKSRLIDELRTVALVRGIRALRGQAISSGGTAYQIFQESLRALTLDTDLGDQELSVLQDLVPDLSSLLGRSLQDAPALGAAAAKERIRRVLISVLTAHREPLLLLLEDLHWATPESLALLRSVQLATQKIPLLIVASYRNDECPSLPKQLPEAEIVSLSRLDRQAIHRLSQSMLGASGTHPKLVELLDRETEGNALFIVEVLRALAEESGGLDAVGSRTLPRHVFSGGVQAVVQRRLTRAPQWTQRLLKLAAVAGRRLDRRLLGALENQLDDWLQACTDAAILEVSESEWRFAHDKLREGLLSTLTKDERRSLHRQIGEAIEQVYAEKERPLATLAHHFDEADDKVKAVRYTSQAGSVALRSGALHEAQSLFERTFALQQQLQTDHIEQAATLRRLARTLLGIGRPADSLLRVRQAMALLGQPIPEHKLALRWALLQELGTELRHRWQGAVRETESTQLAVGKELLLLVRSTNDALFVTPGHKEEAILVILRALHTAERVDDLQQQINYLGWLAYASYVAPFPQLGRFYLRRAEALLTEDGQSIVYSSLYSFSAYILAAEGEFERSLLGVSKWIEKSTQDGDMWQAALGHSSRAATRLLMEDLDGVMQDGEACLQCGTKLQNPIYMASGIAWKLIVLLRRGEASEAYQLAQEVRQLVSSGHNSVVTLTAHGLLAWAALCNSHHAESASEADLALARMQRISPATPSNYEGYVSTLLACLELASMAQTESDQHAADKRLQLAIFQMARFARVFPIGWPQVFLGIGRYLGMRGQRRAAMLAFDLGLRLARRYHLRTEERLLTLWQHQLGDSPPVA
jgi:serine/threonine protein kinase